MYTIKLHLSNPCAGFSGFYGSNAQSLIQPLQVEAVAKLTLSPCIGICELRSDGLCEGCLRTGDEIASWSGLTDAARNHIMDVVLPSRESA